MKQTCCPICGAVYVRRRGEWVLAVEATLRRVIRMLGGDPVRFKKN